MNRLEREVLEGVRAAVRDADEQGGGGWTVFLGEDEYRGTTDRRGIVVLRKGGKGRARRFRILVEELPQVRRRRA